MWVGFISTKQLIRTHLHHDPNNCPPPSQPLLLLQYLLFLLTDFNIYSPHNQKWSTHVSVPLHEQLQFCQNSHLSTYFLVIRKMSLWYGLVFVNYSFTFCEMTSHKCHLNAFQQDSASAVVHITLVKLSNCRNCRKKPDFIPLDFWR